MRRRLPQGRHRLRPSRTSSSRRRSAPSSSPPATSSTRWAASSPRASRATASTATARYADVIDGLAVRAAGLGLGPDGRRDPPALRRQGAADRRLPALRRLARPREGHELLLARSAACTSPSTRCSTATRCTTARPCVFYMDIRAAGKGYDEFTRRAIEQDGAEYLRGRVSRIYRDGDDRQGGRLRHPRRRAGRRSTPTWWCSPRRCARSRAVEALAQTLSVSYDEHGFINEAHPKLRPVETNTAGVFVAGACQAPQRHPRLGRQASADGRQGARRSSPMPSSSASRSWRAVNEATCIGCMHLRARLPLRRRRGQGDPRPRGQRRARRSPASTPASARAAAPARRCA